MPELECDIALIAAVAENRVVGMDGAMPWRLPADLKHFKALTEGKVVIMGRKTYDSIGRPLPNRTNFILTRQTDHFQFDERCSLFHTLSEAISAANQLMSDKTAERKQKISQGNPEMLLEQRQEIMIMGGAQIYAAALPLARRFYLTEVHAAPKGDTLFPPFHLSDWRQVSRQRFRADERNQYDYSFVELERDISNQHS